VKREEKRPFTRSEEGREEAIYLEEKREEKPPFRGHINFD